MSRYYYAVIYASGRHTTTTQHVQRRHGPGMMERINLAANIYRFPTLTAAREWVSYGSRIPDGNMRDLVSSLTGWPRFYVTRSLRESRAGGLWEPDALGGEVCCGRED